MRITDLDPGAVYVVRAPFRDDEGTLVLEGDRMTVERVDPVAFEGAFRVAFREETLVLHEDRQREVVEHAERFLRLV
jgi:hypothetical protein